MFSQQGAEIEDNPENVNTSAITHKEAKAETELKAAHGSKNPFDKENDHEDDNPSSRKIVHDLQLPSFEKLVNVIDIEDEDDSDFEDYLPACL